MNYAAVNGAVAIILKPESHNCREQAITLRTSSKQQLWNKFISASVTQSRRGMKSGRQLFAPTHVEVAGERIFL
jgi:hypothetical protein